jgi:GST-like protein
MGGIVPMFGQIGFFNKSAGKDYEDKRPRDRYVAESRRLMSVVLNRRLAERSWIMGDAYTIADISTFRGCATSSPFAKLSIWSVSPTSRV